MLVPRFELLKQMFWHASAIFYGFGGGRLDWQAGVYGL